MQITSLHSVQKLHGLDHLRALAISYVFLFHYFILSGGQPAWLPDFAGFGWTGVDLFFVLSGFLIASQLFIPIKAGQKISFPNFFLKRFFRIIPAYLLTLVLYFSIPFFREKEALPPVWKFLTFTQNLGLNLRDFGTFSHAWSLCVEEHFYLLLPLLLLCFQSAGLLKRAFCLIPVLFILGFLLRHYSYSTLYFPKMSGIEAGMSWYKYIYYPSYNRLDGLLVGVSVAVVYRFLPRAWNNIINYGNLFIALGLCILIGTYFLCIEPHTYQASVFGFPLVAIGYGCIVTGAISPSVFLYRYPLGITSWIARLSYAIYLTHKGVIHMTHKLLEDQVSDPNLMLFICILSCTAAAVLVHFIVEQPFMRLRDKVLKST